MFTCFVACREAEVGSITPEIDTTYELLDPATGQVTGTVRFYDTGSYLFTRTLKISSENGIHNVTVRTIGNFQQSREVLTLGHTTHQSFVLYDRWGNAQEVTPAIVAQIKKMTPVPDCIKVVIQGDELILL